MNGLRRNEIASLTPRSFDLKSEQPTVTVEAIPSKHKKKDILPLHHDFVETVKGWIKGLTSGEKLFPKLGNRRTWLMVKKDLERVGIANFHAAGRHTHITELFRNGATVLEAQKLARHTDVKQTMKYTHIGLSDQAKALSKLPTSLLHRCCISGVSDGHSVATHVSKADPKECQNPEKSQGFDTDCQSLASTDNLEAAGIEPATYDLKYAPRGNLTSDQVNGRENSRHVRLYFGHMRCQQHV